MVEFHGTSSRSCPKATRPRRKWLQPAVHQWTSWCFKPTRKLAVGGGFLRALLLEKWWFCEQTMSLYLSNDELMSDLYLPCGIILDMFGWTWIGGSDYFVFGEILQPNIEWHIWSLELSLFCGLVLGGPPFEKKDAACRVQRGPYEIMNSSPVSKFQECNLQHLWVSKKKYN